MSRRFGTAGEGGAGTTVPVQIRHAQPADAEAIVPLFARSWRDDGIEGFFEHGGLMAEIDELFVRENLRGQGIGRALVAQASRGLPARGCHALQMQVADGNLEAQRFYRRLDFDERSGYRMWMRAL